MRSELTGLSRVVVPRKSKRGLHVKSMRADSCQSRVSQQGMKRIHLLYQVEQFAKVIGLLLIQRADLLDKPVLRLVTLHLPGRQALPAQATQLQSGK